MKKGPGLAHIFLKKSVDRLKLQLIFHHPDKLCARLRSIETAYCKTYCRSSVEHHRQDKGRRNDFVGFMIDAFDDYQVLSHLEYLLTILNTLSLIFGPLLSKPMILNSQNAGFRECHLQVNRRSQI